MGALFPLGAYVSAFKAMLPRGRAWAVEEGSVQDQLVTGLSHSLVRLDEASQALLVDAFPATAVNLLPEWEESLGLPDPCAGGDPDIAQREASVVARLTDSGGQSTQHFIDFAGALGFTITITTFTPFRAGHGHAGDPIYGADWLFAWQINAPLANLQPNAVLECEIRARAAAQTYVLFVYGEPGQLDFSLDDGRNTAFLGAL